MPSLTRTLLEIFVFRQREGHWEILGRAVELPPAARAGDESVAQPRRFSAPDPLGPDRRAIAEKILLWAVSGRAPDGIKRPFPGGTAVAGESQVLLSDESLGGVEEVSVPGARVVLLSPGALLERTVLESGGVWIRFESLEFEGDAATARVALVAPVLPPPRPGEEPTRVLARMEAHFARSGEAWVLTRFRPLN